ncbi:hypothetical protein EGW08_011455 [Elysia chlorotica]|uniref:Guanylate cyclase domain-containing protein n=1 Tax=Elysia chlorotica TaxID=188477 RepID=A0A3S0ZK59_ELYCH|nr:hypothetical protein EGW08_011455 [Elysia chlorotica]
MLRCHRCKSVEAEYFKSVTIMFCDINDFNNLIQTNEPSEAITLLNTMSNMIDSVIADYDVFKVENVFDSYMVASGPCVAGTVTITPPQYCLFGHSVSIASRMKACCPPNSILISHSTQRILRSKDYLIKFMSIVNIKLDEKQNETPMKTFRLVGTIGSGRKKDDPSYGMLKSATHYRNRNRSDDRTSSDHGTGGRFPDICDSTSLSHDPAGSTCGGGKLNMADEKGGKERAPSPKKGKEELQCSEGGDSNKPAEVVQPAPEPGPHTYDL